MKLPSIEIKFQNGALGSSAPSDDGVVGLITSGTATEKFAHGAVKLITTLKDLADLAIGETGDNAHIYKTVKEFYTEAPTGSKLWLMMVSDSVTMEGMFTNANYAEKLVEAANGAINLIITKKTGAKVAEKLGLDADAKITPLDADVYLAMSAAQTFADKVTEEKYAPLFVLLEGRYYNGTPADLSEFDLRENKNNHVGILIGDTETNTNGACIYWVKIVLVMTFGQIVEK